MSKLIEALIEEKNAIKKDLSKIKLKIAFCYPNSYQAGMASLGLQLIYQLWNSYEDVACERTFLPIKDFVTPYTLESDRFISEMDVIAFTLQYEDDYTNVIKILKRAGIPLESKERNDNHPLIIAGGPCAQANPVPLSPYIDAFMMGDLEPVSDSLINEGLLLSTTRKERMETLDTFPWMWVPSNNFDKRVKFSPRGNLDDYFYPIKQIIQQVELEDPWHGVFGKSFLLEVVRGCSRSCSFCLAGKINRPKRDRSLRKLIDLYHEGSKQCDVSKVTLMGSGISDYKQLEDLCENLVNDGFSFSLPSLRADRITKEICALLVKAKQKTITTAPEAGTERLREEIGKPISDEEILEAVENAAENNITRLKAYFILGLPTETDEDIQGIVNLGEKIKTKSKGLQKIRFSCGYFVPKPKTKYQNESIENPKILQKKGNDLMKKFTKISKIDCEVYSAKWARIQTILSVGGLEIALPLKKAALLGGRLGDWRKALQECNLDIETLSEKRIKLSEHPWDFIRV